MKGLRSGPFAFACARCGAGLPASSPATGPMDYDPWAHVSDGIHLSDDDLVLETALIDRVADEGNAVLPHHRTSPRRLPGVEAV